MSTKPSSMMEEPKEPQGTSRPIVSSKQDSRVSQYAAKNDMTKRDAYDEIIEFLLDSEGNVREDNIVGEDTDE